MKIIFFYSRFTGFMEGVVKELYQHAKVDKITVVHWDDQNLPFTFDSKYATYLNRSSFNDKKLFKLLKTEEPSILYMSGWMDKGYIKSALQYKRNIKSDIKIVAGIDDQWHGTLRQKLGVLVHKFYLNKLYDYFWIAGHAQYYYARKMGYNDDKIIYNMLSADTNVFNKQTEEAPPNKRLLFVGRLHEDKNLVKFLEVYNSLDHEIQKEFPFVIIGDGPQRESIFAMKSKYVKMIPFLEKENLIEELKKGGVFVMPSKHEQWGVAIHEAALLGFPLLLSKFCGATSYYLIDGYNGYSFDSSKSEDIKKALTKITRLSDKQFCKYSEGSAKIGTRITSEISAYSLLSILEKQ